MTASLVLSAAVLLTPGAPVRAACGNTPVNDAWTASLMFENDLFGDTDEQYTNGLKLSWISPDLSKYRDSGRLPEWSLPMIERLPFINEPCLQRNVAFSIGQKIFTPEDIATTTLLTDDRPYAGWLYASAAFHNKNERRLDTFEIQLGVIGPASLAEEAQNLVHRLRDIPEAQGWDNQLDNEPAFAIIVERKWRGLSYRNQRGLGFDGIAHAGGALGTVYSYLNAGFELRAGWNVPVDFGTSVMRPGGDTNAPVDTSDPRFSTDRPFSLHGFVGLTARLFGRNLFLDGNTFSSSQNVNKEYVVGDLIVGASMIAWGVKISYAQVFRSREFENQADGHNFGSLSLSWTF